MGQEYLSLREVADHLGIHVNTVRNAINRGELEAYDLGDGYKTTPESVNRYVESKKVKPRAMAAAK